MKITEKMYLLAKEIVQEYEKEDFTNMRHTMKRNLSKGKATLYFSDKEGNLFDSDLKPIDKIKSISDAEFKKLYLGDFNNESMNNSKSDNIKSPIDKIKTKKEEDFSFEVRNCYIDCIAQFDPDLRPETEKEIISWHDTIDKLNRIDKLEFQDIVLLTKAARNDPFWKKNFMSLIKLRRKNKDKIPYWKVFKEKFKFEKSKSESTFDAMNEVLKNIK